MLFSNDRRQLRGYFSQAWRKYRAGQPLEPLEALIAEVIARHPEYQPAVSGPEDGLEQDYSPELGEPNPFLHMGMHIAIQEQLMGARPAGINALYQALCRRFGDSHTAEHRMMECLGETLWEAQRTGTLPDEALYLQRLKKLAQHS